MPFCPNCHGEFEDGVTACPDCGESLVEQLPDESEAESEPLTLLVTAPDEATAAFWRSVLAEAGIQSPILSAEAGGVINPYIRATGIYVRESDASRARELLRPLAEGPAAEELAGGEEEFDEEQSEAEGPGEEAAAGEPAPDAAQPPSFEPVFGLGKLFDAFRRKPKKEKGTPGA